MSKPRVMNRRYLSFALTLVWASAALAACGRQAGLPSELSQAPSNRTAAAVSGRGDDWVTFGRDYERTGFQPQSGGLSAGNVAKLRVRWKRSVGQSVYASPLAYGGNVIVVTLGEGTHAHSTVFDFRASDGLLLWKRALLGGVRATPSIDPATSELFVSDRIKLPNPSNVYAIRLLDGSIAWQQHVPGFTHASPVVAGGRVYVGVGGGDPPVCTNGGIMAFDEQTGAPLWRWKVSSQSAGGGSVWGAIAYDGQHLFAGTGNTCSTPVTTANGAVALNLDGSVAWNYTAVQDSMIDDDTGSGILLSDGRATFVNKDGSLFSVGQGDGTLVWKTPLGAEDEWGGYATPSTDGSTIVVGAGFFFDTPASAGASNVVPMQGQPSDVLAGATSRLDGLDDAGVVRWTRTMTNRITGDVALSNGLAFTALDRALVVLDLKTGKTLWRYATPNYIDASPIVVPSGVYAADDNGNVIALSIP
jgi:outer membrane protein assembly factor BamB